MVGRVARHLGWVAHRAANYPLRPMVVVATAVAPPEWALYDASAVIIAHEHLTTNGSTMVASMSSSSITRVDAVIGGSQLI